MGVAVLLLVTVGCARESPTTPSPSIEFLSLEYGYRCGNWYPAVPPSIRTQVDLDFASSESLTDAARAAIAEYGGRVVYEFVGGPKVRVEMGLDRIPEFWGSTNGFWVANTVRNPESFSIRVIVHMDHPPVMEDVLATNALGAVLALMSSYGNWFVVVVDDRRVPELKRLPGVVSVSYDGIGCIF